MRLPLLFLLFCSLAGCGKAPIVPRTAPGRAQADITVTSPAFSDGTRIPVDHTCDGKDAVPEIVLSAAPEGAKSLVVVIEDPDVQAGSLTHMVAFNLSPETHKIPMGTDLSTTGETSRFGLNDFNVTRYSGPCPPRGETHRYYFRIIALDTILQLPEGAPRAQVDEAMDGHILGQGILTGHFGH